MAVTLINFTFLLLLLGILPCYGGMFLFFRFLDKLEEERDYAYFYLYLSIISFIFQAEMFLIVFRPVIYDFTGVWTTFLGL